jgi:DNA-binding NarL/FixJ family response regulator
MDLQMPDMSGIDAIISIRQEFPEARIVVLTTYAGDVLAQRALKAGAQAYMLKSDVRKVCRTRSGLSTPEKGAFIPKSPPSLLTTSGTRL